MKTMFFTLCLMLALLPGLWANNVTLNDISLSDQSIATHSCNIIFDISWENSWRTSNTVPTNWDACWVFAKYRVTGGEWHHCTLSNVSGEYFCPGGCVVNASPDGKGVFLYRAQDGSGSIDWDEIKFPWKYGIDGVNDDAEVEVKVFAIEMVYVPQGNFYIGDGNVTDESTYALHGETTDLAVQIDSTLVSNISVDSWSGYDDANLHNGLGIKGNGGLDNDNNGIIDNASYPTGWRAFYIMKYETSQEQYAEFLNMLTRTQQQARIFTDISGTTVTNIYVMSNSIIPSSGNVIRCASDIPAAPIPVTFFCDWSIDGQQDECDGQNLVCNKLGWGDVCAYADWTGLRPMTELEYEKATRGPNTPVVGEYAWGNTNIAIIGVSQTDYACPNSSLVLSPNEHTGRAMCAEIGAIILGLARCGEFASSSVNHTRQESGAGYYGAMEMSGSISEPVVTLGNIAGRSFRGINGNGELDAAGYADADYWPGINGNAESFTENGPYDGSVGVTQYAGSGFRGGHMGQYVTALMISYRYYASMGFPLSREDYHGARFVRSAY